MSTWVVTSRNNTRHVFFSLPLLFGFATTAVKRYELFPEDVFGIVAEELRKLVLKSS